MWELVTSLPYKPAGPPEDAGARPKCPTWWRQWPHRDANATAHESRYLIPQVEAEAQGWKELGEIPQPCSSEGLGSLQRLLGLECPRAEGLQGSNRLGRLLPGCLAGPWGVRRKWGRPGPGACLLSRWPNPVAVNDYPAACQYRSQVQFEGQETLDCAQAGGQLHEAWGHAHLPF